MAGQKMRGYFAFLLAIFASLTLGFWIVSFGLWSSYSRYQTKLEHHRSARYFEKEAKAPPPKDLGASFWQKFEIVSDIHLGRWQRGVNDFAGQVSYSLPAVMSLSEGIKLRWQVMPLRAEGVGQAIALRADGKLLNCPSPAKDPLLVWFNNGQSVPFSIQKCGGKFHDFATDPTQSIKLAGTLKAGAVPILISQGKQGIRLFPREERISKEILAWYRHICAPENNSALLADIQGWYIQATELNQDSLENVEWGKSPVEVTNFLPFA